MNEPFDTTSGNATFTFSDGLEVERLGFGAMRLTGQGIWGEPEDHDEAIGVLRRAVELGVNLIDTADAYGPEVSEKLIAEALVPYPADLVIATKGGLVRSGPDEWEPNGRPEHLRKALEGSLKRLELERIDLYQFHRPDPEVPFEESVGVLVNLQNEGKIRHLGLSNVSVSQLERARELTEIVSVQNRYNLTDRTSEEVLAYCEQHGIGFFPWAPLALGKLEEPGSVLDELSQKYEATPGQLALAWLLKKSPVMLPIPGTSKVAHLEKNLEAVDIGLDDEEMQRLEALGE